MSPFLTCVSPHGSRGHPLPLARRINGEPPGGLHRERAIAVPLLVLTNQPHPSGCVSVAVPAGGQDVNRLGELTDSQGQLLPLSLALRFLHSHLRILHRSVPLPKVLRISSWRFRLFQSPSPLTPGEHTSPHGLMGWMKKGLQMPV